MPRSMTSWRRNAGDGRAAFLLAGLLVTACSNDAPLAERVEAQVRRGEADRALALLGKEIRARPTDWATQDLRVRVLLQAERADEALQAYAERWTQDGRDTSALFRGIAVALLREGLRSADGLIRTRAGAALAAWQAPDLWPVLRDALAHPEASIRALGAEASASGPGTRQVDSSGRPSTTRSTRCGRPLRPRWPGDTIRTRWRRCARPWPTAPRRSGCAPRRSWRGPESPGPSGC